MVTKDRVLRHVARQTSITPQELAYAVKITPKAAYAHLQRHARAGLLAAARGRWDALRRFTLTDRGRQYLAFLDQGEGDQARIEFR